MGESVILDITDKKLAEELREKGIAEVALRRADSKFRAFVKCRTLNPSESATATLPNPFQPDPERKNILSLENVRNVLASLSRENGVIKDSVKDLACRVEDVYQLTSSVKNIACLNLGFSLANMAVDVAGFAIVTEKLNMLHSEIQAAADKIKQISNVLKNEKLGECEKLIMQCNAMAAKLKDAEDVDLDKLQELLINMKAYISELILDLHDDALDEEMLLNMVYSLMPAYTSLFHEFLRGYFFQKGDMPANYGIFLSLYEKFGDEDFLERLQDYYFLRKKMHATDTLDILNVHKLIGLNGMVQIEDQYTLLRALGTKEKMNLLENELSRYVERKAQGTT